MSIMGRPKRICRLVVVAGCCGMLLANCSKKSGGQVGGQVVAHVGDEVITTQELNNEFRWSNIPTDKQSDPATVRRVLGELVLRKYLDEQAIASKLDREPGVLLDILRSKEQVLANAYLQRNAGLKSPSKSDVDQYIANNPSKFADRKLLSIDQIAFPLSPDSQSVIDANKDAKSLDEVDQRLTAAGVLHSRQTGRLDSAEISQDFFNQIEAKKADDVFFVRAGPNGIFFKVTGEESHPIQGDAASNLARQLLRADALKAEAGMASVSANLATRYEADYANIMSQKDGNPEKAK